MQADATILTSQERVDVISFIARESLGGSNDMHVVLFFRLLDW